MNRILPITALAIPLVLGVTSGCTRVEERTVATVGDKKITFQEVENQYSRQGFILMDKYELMQESALNTLIEEKLQLCEAEARGYGNKEEIEKILEDKKRILAVNHLYNLKVVDKAKVTPREVRKIYELSSEELLLKHILVSTEEEAKSIYDSLILGTDFDSLAKHKSIDANTKDKGGFLGPVRWGQLSDDVMDAALKLDNDDISVPVKSYAGWHIVKLIKRSKAVDQRPFEEMKKRIETRLMQKKMRARAQSYIERIKKLAEMHYDEDVVKSVAEKVPQESVSPWAQAPLPNVSDEDKEKVLVTTRYGEWTVGKILEWGKKSPPRSSVDTPEGLKRWVDMIIVEQWLVDEALKKGLDRSKEVREEIERERDRQMVSLLHSDVIESKSEPTEEEIKAEYEANKEKYAIPEKNYVSVIVTFTEDQAKNILLRLRKGEDFKKLAEEKSIHPSKQRGGNIGLVDKNIDPLIFKAAKELKVDRLSNPIRAKRGWAVIRVTTRELQKIRTFEEVHGMVRRDLKTSKTRKNHDIFIAELKEKYPIIINEELLKLVGEKQREAIEEAEKKKAS